MRNSRLVRMLEKLEKAQVRSFKDFVCSPYWNKNEKLMLLCEFVTRFHGRFDSKDFTEEAAFDHVFTQEPFKDKAIYKLLSKLYKLFEQFIITEKTNNNGVIQRLLYLNFLGEYDLMKDYNLYLSNILKQLDEDEVRDANYFYQKFLVEQEKSLGFRSKVNLVSRSADVLQAEKALDIFYIILKLNYAYTSNSLNKINPTIQGESSLLEEIVAYTPNSPYFDIPAVKIWYTSLLLAESENKKSYYEELKELLFSHYKELNKFDIHNIITNLSNHCRYVFQDKPSFYRESFELNKFSLETVAEADPMLFTPIQYFNLVNVGIWLGELEWVETFLEKHKDYPVNRDDDVYLLGLTMLAFAQEKFDKVQDYLLDSRLKYIYFRLYERRLWLKIFIEKKLEEQVEYQVNNMRKFLSVNKDSIAEHHLVANRNFTNIVAQVNYLIPTDQDRIQQQLDQIRETSASVLPDKNWLEAKVQALLK